MPAPLPIVVTPLRFELRVLQRAAPPLDLHCCGPGAQAITAWAVAGGRTDRPVVLAGLAGGLTPRATAGSAFAVDAVVDAEGKSWPAPLAARLGAKTPGVAVVSVRNALTESAAKRALGATCRADLVDLESMAFAIAATKLGWQWGIVRGVSDGPEDDLPDNAGHWVDPRGRTRNLRAAFDAVVRPASIPGLIKLRRHSLAAMHGVAARLAGLTNESGVR